jgi:uncharacterized cupin superfamily protein
MHKYKPGDDVGPLEDWPFDNPSSDYKIRKGSPKASGRIDVGGTGYTTRYGIWRCTKGAVECTEQGDEMMTILSGKCRLIDHTTGDVVTLEPNDTYFARDGSRVTWDIIEDITKVFYGYKASQF